MEKLISLRDKHSPLSNFPLIPCRALCLNFLLNLRREIFCLSQNFQLLLCSKFPSPRFFSRRTSREESDEKRLSHFALEKNARRLLCARTRGSLRSVTPRCCFSSILHSLSFSLLSFPFPQSPPSSKVPCKGTLLSEFIPAFAHCEYKRVVVRGIPRDGSTRNTRPACPRNERVLLFNPLRTLSDYSTCAAAAAALTGAALRL